MNEIRQLAAAITEKYGVVKRARGCFLYTAKGVRLTDLYQESGRAILGWGSSSGTSAFTVLKNVLSRGATGSFDTDYTPRADGSAASQLSRAVSALLADSRTVWLFASRSEALSCALQLAPEHTACYKPWAEHACWSEESAVVIEPPLPLALSLSVLALKPELSSASAAQALLADKSVRVASPLVAAATRSLYDLKKALQEREEKHFFLYDTVVTKYWTRKGPYLYPKIPEERYADFVLHCLSQALVVSPLYNQPSIVPFGADRGVFRALEKNPFIV